MLRSEDDIYELRSQKELQTKTRGCGRERGEVYRMGEGRRAYKWRGGGRTSSQLLLPSIRSELARKKARMETEEAASDIKEV